MPPNLVEPPPDLEDCHLIYIFFGFSVVGRHWEFSHYHVASHDGATWQPIIGPCHLVS
jgi:hypothetical protein